MMHIIKSLAPPFHRLEDPQLLQYASSVWQNAYRSANLGMDLGMFFEDDVIDASSIEAMCQGEASDGASDNYHLEWRNSHP